MLTYNVKFENDVLRIGFGEPGQNTEIVPDAIKGLDELIKNEVIKGGELIRVNGAASLPAAMVIGHKLAHLYQAVACWDPKLSKYVVAIAHGPTYKPGQLVE